MTQTHQQTSTTVPTGVALTPLEERFRAQPDLVLDELRAAEPMHRDEVLKRWVLSSHENVDALLRDRSLSANPANGADGTFMKLFAGPADHEPSILFLDPPRHTHLRGLVSKAFTPRALEAITPRVQEIVDELLDAVAGEASFDLIASFAGPLPTIVIAEMLGVDPADQLDFKRWSDDGVLAFDPMITPEQRVRVEMARAELQAYLHRAIAECRRQPREDLISALTSVQDDDGKQLSDDEIVTMCSLLLAAGNVTTTDLIGNGVLALLQHRDELAKLQADPSLIGNAVEEMLRYASPVTETGRVAVADITVAGCPVQTGDSLIPVLAAANHDPAVYPEPHRFDITRADTHHHSFGGGVHFCLGAPLARIEAQLAIGTLVRRFPNLRLADGPLEWRRLPGFQGLTRLMVTA